MCIDNDGGNRSFDSWPLSLSQLVSIYVDDDSRLSRNVYGFVFDLVSSSISSLKPW